MFWIIVVILKSMFIWISFEYKLTREFKIKNNVKGIKNKNNSLINKLCGINSLINILLSCLVILNLNYFECSYQLKKT